MNGFEVEMNDKIIVVIGKNCPTEKLEELQTILAESGQNIDIVQSDHAEHGTVKMIEDCRGLHKFKKLNTDHCEYLSNNRKGGKRKTKKEWD